MAVIVKNNLIGLMLDLADSDDIIQEVFAFIFNFNFFLQIENIILD